MIVKRRVEEEVGGDTVGVRVKHLLSKSKKQNVCVYLKMPILL